MATHFDSEHDMHTRSTPHMTHRAYVPHSQSWRDQQHDDDDALGVAKGLVNALMLSIALWGVGGAIWLALAVLMGWN